MGDRGWGMDGRGPVKKMMSMAHWHLGLAGWLAVTLHGAVVSAQASPSALPGRPSLSVSTYLACLAGEGAAVSLSCRGCGPTLR